MEQALDAVCRWDAPSGAGSVFLNVFIIGELRSKAIEAFLALPKRGVETGGLLFGRQQAGHIYIQGSEEIACDHSYGPSFTLSSGDRDQLAFQLSQTRPEGWLPVIGFYRSYTGRKPALEAAELALLRDHFPEGPFVFLMLQPVSSEKCLAGFRLCLDGEVLPDPPYTPVLFDPGQLNSPVQAMPNDIDPELTPEAPVKAAAAFASAPPDRPIAAQSKLPPPYRSLVQEIRPPLAAAPPRRAQTRWWLPVLVSLMCLVAGVGVYELWTLASQPRWTELYLDAKPLAGSHSLDITWDTAAPKSAGATHALLGITDGSVHHDVALSQFQLQLGHYAYRPEHADVELRLILYGRGLALTGSALRLAAARVISQTPAVPPAGQVPAVQAAGQVPSAPPELPARAPVPTKPKTPEPSLPRAAVREVQPQVSAGIRARLKDRIEIPVSVKIDAGGRVIAATTPSSGDGLYRYLAGEAVKSARQWRFTPARGGAPTAEKTIHFTFVP